jgi:hypothetical protein
MPYRLGGHPGEYCSRGCVNMAFELMRKGRKYEKAQPERVDYIRQDEREEAAAARASPAREAGVDVKAEEFGGAGVYRRYCDNPACEGPITVSWRGRRGEYCSNDCLKTEKDKTMTTATEETTEEAASPIAAGAPAAKKAKGKKADAKTAVKKAAAKPTPAAKKAAAPKAAPGDRASYPNDAVIVMPKAYDHGRRGKSGDAFDALKNGITVGKYREAVKKKNPKNGSWYIGETLKFALAEGIIKLKQ